MERKYNRSELYQFPSSQSQAIDLQNKWVQFIEDENATKISLKDIRIIAGVDLTYLNDTSSEYGIGCAVLWDIEQRKEISHSYSVLKVQFPYKSGLLLFREIRIASIAIENLKQTPDLIVFDGHGRAHPRRFGAAVAIGVAMNIPSIGVAKKSLVGPRKWSHVQRKAGNKYPIIDKEELVGYAVVLLDNLSPVFVSAGYKIDLDTSVEIALLTTRFHKQPECLGLAHDYLQKEKHRLLVKFLSKF